MSRRRGKTAQGQAQEAFSRRDAQRSEPSDRLSRLGPGENGLGVAALLADPRLAHPANVIPRAEGVRALQRQAGNATTQRLLRQAHVSPDRPATVQQRSAEVVARTLATAVTQAETRAGGTSGAWNLPEADRTRILGMLRSGRAQTRRGAVAAVWRAIRGGLRLAGRVQGQLTARLGVVDGEQVGPASGTAVTLFYVPATAGCAALRQRYEEQTDAEDRDPAALQRHQQIHSTGSASEIRAIIQVNPAIVREGGPEEILARIHSTLMHEYTHVEQQLGRGIHEGITFKAVRDREFLVEGRVPGTGPQVALLGALDEIEAVCSEIENAQRTRLAQTFDVNHMLNYLWQNYERYHDAVCSRPGHRQALTAIARRVHRSILAGRTMLRQYLTTGQGARTVRSDLRTTMLRALTQPLNRSRFPPPGYHPDKVDPFLQSPPQGGAGTT